MSTLLGIYTIQRQLEPHKSYVLHTLRGGRGKPPGDEVTPHPEFPTLSRIHPDTHDIPERLLRRFLLSETTLYKQAVIPTERHASIIRKYLPYSRGMIILVRNPADAVSGYIRHYSHGHGLYDIDPSYHAAAFVDHRRFVRRQIENFGADPRVHFICYERLMLHTATVMNECLEFLGSEIRAPRDYALPRRRFTGLGLERLSQNTALRARFTANSGDFRAEDLLDVYGLRGDDDEDPLPPTKERREDPLRTAAVPPQRRVIR